MLTHPGTASSRPRFAAAETEGASGQDFITGVAAGYEVMERMAADWIPTVMARGFHAGPVFSIFGAAIAAAKIMRFTEDQVHAAISLCTNLAGSNLESRAPARRRRGAQRHARRRAGEAGKVGGGEAVLEGPAGFYHAYAGNNTGQLTYSFVGDTQTSLDKLTAGLGKEWMFLETLYRIYSIRRLQHRPHRRHGEAVRRAQHQVRGRRSRRGGRELAGDAVSEPGLPDAARRHGGEPTARQHAVLHARTASSSAGSRCWPARPIRPRCWS